MKIVFILILCALSFNAFAQEDSAQYLRQPFLPSFTLLKPDSTYITNQSLRNDAKTLVFVFYPDCEHCRHLTDSLLSHADAFKSLQILMISYAPLQMIDSFYKEKQLENYKNILIGRDLYYFFMSFYKVKNFPFLALYNESGQLIKHFNGNPPIEVLLKTISDAH